jgi:uncharacterized protein YfaS (alpha-2-macroglobulin family)
MALGALVLAAALVTSLIVVNTRDHRDAASTPSDGSGDGTASTGPSHPTSTPVTVADGPGGNAVLPAGFSIRAGTARPADNPAPAVLDGSPLADAVVAKILDRLPDWKDDRDLGTDFHWPAQTLVKPTAGKTINQTFPAPDDSQNPPKTPTPPAAGPLKVLRIQPQGDVTIAPFVSITFNQPMVPVSTVGTVSELPESAVPASISPKVPGHWDWIGTSTLRFSADSDTVDRLPMATRFTVTVPAGATSTGGGTLKKPAIATFTTPAPEVQTFTPDPQTPTKLKPVLVAVFNQRVDPVTVLKTVTVTANGTPQPVRIATADEIAKDDTASATVSAAADGRAVAFVPQRDLPADTTVTVTIPAGTRGAEGPLTSTKAATYSFHTHPALTPVSTNCGGGPCKPGSPIVLEFSNPLDPTAFDPDSVSVQPAVPGGASISAAGNAVMVTGATQAQTRYTVTVRAGLKDVFGQTLSKAAITAVTIGHADTQLYPFPTPVTTLDPTTKAHTVTVTTVNITRFRERVFAVDLDDWSSYRAWHQNLQQLPNYHVGTDLHIPDWTVLVDRTVRTSAPSDKTVATTLDLGAQLKDGRTTLVALVEPLDPPPAGQNWQNQPTTTWVQSTTLAVDAITDAHRMSTWVTDLRTGKPIAGAAVVQLGSSGQRLDQSATTDAHGLASLDLTVAGASAVLATKGDQTALLPGQMWGGSWQSAPDADRLLWYVTDDRQTYRPGETMSVKGWVRRQAGGTDTTLTTPAAGTVSWTATDGYGTKIGDGTAAVDAAGGFDLTVAIPAGAHLGAADLNVTLAGSGDADQFGNDLMFTIADYRTPAFEVDTHSGTADPAVRGADLPVQADASYYAGGPLADAPVDWQVSTTTATYAPPGWSEYTFGIWTPWWFDGPYGTASYADAVAGPSMPGICCTGPNGGDSDVQTFHGTTDGSGSDYLAVTVGNLGKDTDGLPVTVQAQATVTDVNRQQIADTATILVHPAEDYVGLASDATFVRQGDTLTVQTITTDIDGTATSGRPVTVSAARVAGGWSAGQDTETLVDPKTCHITSTTAPVGCTFTPKVGGQYRITAVVTDADGRTSRSQLTRWVAGPDGTVATTVQEQTLTLVPNAKEYRPGQSATLLVASPIDSGTGLITLSHNGIVSSRTFPVSGGSAVVTIPIDEKLIPGVTATVEVVGSTPRSTDPASGTGTRPAYATGQITLAVSRMSRSLTVTATPRDATVKPGGSTTIDVDVTGPGGKPVAGSQFEIVVVDEAVLALSDYRLPDPLQAFYPDDQWSWVSGTYGRSTVMLATDQQGDEHGDKSAATAAAMPSAQAGSASASASAGYSGAADSAAPTRAESAAGSSATTPITQRSAFEALALFRPTVTTGADGTAAVPVTLPDNLTRYRIMVVAVAGDDRFGSGESTITAGLPLTVRPSPPRFLNFGDRAELPVVVQNLTSTALTTDVVLQGANLTVASSGSGPTAGATGKQVTVPANGRIEVRFAVAADRAGTAKFRVAAVSGDDADAAEQDFPVYTPATSETFATYGTLDPSDGTAVVAQKLTKPDDVIPAFGGLQITTSSTALAQLTDAVDYVTDYDYTSSDALANQAMAISSLGDVLQAFSAPGRPTVAQMKKQVARDVTALIRMQNDDGGFAAWQVGQQSEPINTVLAVQALLVADRSGYAGDTTAAVTKAVSKALGYLRNIDAHLPPTTSQQTRDTINADALAVRHSAGDSAAATDADGMVTARGSALPMDAVGWLLPVVSSAQRQTLLTRVTNAAVDNAGSVTFTESVTDDAWTVLHSDTRTDAVILDALLSVAPGSDLIGKVVNGLMGAQRGGRWNTISDNAFALVALRHYYDTFESTSPDFVASAWLGDTLTGTHHYAGHTTDQTQVTIPTSELLKRGDASITLADKGSGRMYYRIGLTTAPSDLSLEPLDRGFVVTRSYAGADNASDVTKDAKGVWHVKAGARVRVTVTLVSRSAQTHVVLSDPLPAGLEPLNPALATTPKDLSGAQNDGGAVPLSWWNPTWYDHQDLRDDRADAFATYLPGGVYTYSYLALATTPGRFVVPPANAKQIYAPETFGRTGTDHVVVG